MDPSRQPSASADLWLEALSDLIANFDSESTAVRLRIVARLHQVGLTNEARRLWIRMLSS